ncbi:hypothetical protein GQ42DRAFT_118222, partial [Ramicandelaber brevisporus]
MSAILSFSRHLTSKVYHAITSPRNIKRLFPIISWIPTYSLRHQLLGDLIAGISVGMMVVPQSLAYAALAGLPVQYGLYSSFMANFAYFFFGTSRTVTVGPTAVLSLIIGQALAQIDHEHPAVSHFVATACIAFLSGCFLLVLGLFRLGFLLDLIPGPVIKGFTSGAAIVILISQLPGMLGIPGVSPRGKPYMVLADTFASMGRIKWNNFAFGVATLVFCIAVIIAPPVPKRLAWLKTVGNYVGVLQTAIAVVLMTLAALAYYRISKADHDAAHGIAKDELPVAIIRRVPAGLPHPRVPQLSSDVLTAIGFNSVIGTAIIAILEQFSIAKAHSRLDGERIDPSQEMVALGAGNILGSFFGACTVGGSFSRTPVNRASGATSPVAGVITSFIVILAMLLLPPLFYYMPSPALSAIIFANIMGLVSMPGYYLEIAKYSRTDALASLLAFVVTIFSSPEVGIAVSVGFSLLALLLRIARPKWKIPSTSLAGSIHHALVSRNMFDPDDHGWTAFVERHLCSGLVVFRLEESLIFPNAEYVRHKVTTAAKRQ